jgi:DNA ligase (NAD+)
METIKSKIEALRKELEKHEYWYYVEGNPQISDKEFDLLLKELEALEEAHPELVTPNSPTQRVGGVATGFETITHRVPMMSIDNSYSFNDIKNWIARTEKLLDKEQASHNEPASSSVFPLIAELKIDGVSGSFTYQNGQLSAGATRGDGKVGDLITSNVRAIRALPLTIDSPLDMDIRGEIYTPISVLSELNQERAEKGLELFKNCRNLTSGTIKSLDPKVVKERKLSVMVYGIAQGLELGFTRHSEVLEFLKKQGFRLNEHWVLCENQEELENFINKMDKKRLDLDFDIDGIVIKVDHLEKQRILGETAKAPRWLVAYKYPQDKATTRLLQVEWQVGRSQITPVAILEPVELGGTTVSRASLHNLDQIAGKDIRLNDQVVVEKAGYIIPYIVESVKASRTGQELAIEPPAQCPACEHPVARTQEPDGATLIFCPNPLCKGVVGRRIIHFITQMEIDNFGPQLVDRLMETKALTVVEDILTLDKATLAQQERMGEKSATKIQENLTKAAYQPFYRLISALGINNVGINLSENIAEAANQSYDGFLNLQEEQLLAIRGISNTVANDILSFLQNPHNENLLNALKSWWQGPAPSVKDAPSANSLADISFVLTGEATLGRKELEKIVKAHGGKVKGSVSSETNYLVIGSLVPENYSSSKKTKALKLGIPIIDEHKLLELAGETKEA